MGYMKDLDIRIRNGGDDAIAAAAELAGLANERRGYEETMNGAGDITDIVTVLRGVGFSAVSPEAGESASLLHYCVTHSADEIERLRAERRWIPVSERLPEDDSVVLAFMPEGSELKPEVREMYFVDGEWMNDRGHWPEVTHWMPLPEPPEVK